MKVTKEDQNRFVELTIGANLGSHIGSKFARDIDTVILILSVIAVEGYGGIGSIPRRSLK